MRYLCIDFGTKWIGIALSDEEGSIAFPHAVWKNSKTLADDLAALAKEKRVGTFVVGESRDLANRANPIMERILPFSQMLEKKCGVPVLFHPEVYSSQEAKHVQEDPEMEDASAAAITLQSYLDSRKRDR
jgi:putative holliday junction resolvase